MIFISSFLHAAGALTGLAIGDALGAPLEGLPPPMRKVTDMEQSPKSKWKKGIFTDDTAQALAVAESLAVCRGYSPYDLITRLISGYQKHPELYGPTSSRVFELVITGKSPQDAARTVHLLAGSSRSNGSVMRGPPIGIFYSGPMVEACSEVCSSLTHYDPVCGACSAFLNRMISDLCRGISKERAYGRALARCSNDEVASRIGEYQRYEPLSDLDALLATHAAIRVFMEEEGFEAVVTRAANLGGDSDTVGALAGSLAGAAFGIGGIPPRWLTELDALPLVIFTAYRLWFVSKE